MTILTVGAGGAFQTIASAVAVSQDGDTIDVAAGTYTNDFLVFSDSITLQAVGGMVVINATVPPPDEMAIITEGATDANVTISGFELTGAAISSDEGNNGAGIRYQGGNLTLTNDYIYDNQEGVLAGTPPVAGTGTISISNSEFADNGAGDGYSHNIYVNNVALLEITNSLFTGAVVGHEIKSRAVDTIITDNVIAGGPTGSDSYSIDLPNGGDATVTGNVIEKGPDSQNPYFISYGEEGVTNPGTSVTISNNTILNDFGSNAVVVKNDSTTTIAFSGNAVYGLTSGQLISGPGTASGTTNLTTEPAVDYTAPWSAAATPPLDWAACFATGTRITTPRGACAVERLAVGDPVLTAEGRAVPVTWIGHRGVSCERHPRPHDVWPVCIHAGAFGDGLPQRDLTLSPDHAVFIDGVLVPIRYLVNGCTIAQVPVKAITYWHVELPTHDVLLAEGLPAESYLDTGNRGAFAGGNEPPMLHPDFALRIWEARACAKLVVDGPELVAARSWLLARAETLGHRTTRAPALRLRTDAGTVAAQADGLRHRFDLPPGTQGLRLQSRAGVPAQMDPESMDCRSLGVAVRALALDGVALALTDTRLGPGWHAAEPGWRWTDGDATIAAGSARTLEIELAMGALYWDDDAADGLIRAA
jgi:hypothetical protein